MSIQLQIALPLFVAFAAVLAVVIVRKYFCKSSVITLALLLALSSAFTVFHFTSGQRANLGGALTDVDGISLMLAEKYIVEERYDDAVQVLTDISISNGNNVQIQTDLARCMLLKGNYTVAVQLYQQLGKGVEKELGYAKNLDAAAQINDNAIIAYLNSEGKKPSDYGMSMTKVGKVAVDDARKHIVKQVKTDVKTLEKQYSDDVVEAVELAASVSDNFADYSESVNGTSQGTKTIKKLEKIMSADKKLGENKHLRIARLKGFVISGNYGKIAEYADSNSSAEEIIIINELYLKNLITRSDFSDDYINLNEERCEEVIEKAYKSLEKNKSSISKDQYKKYKESIDMLDKHLDNDPALFAIRYNLQSHIDSGDDAIRSKCYLALAKLEDYCGNDEMAQNYINEAIGTASDSDDDNYRVPMVHVSGIINGTSDSEDVKNVALYVDQALDNSLPVGIDINESSLPENTPSYGDTQQQQQEQNNFSDTMIGGVLEKTAAINIGSINKDNFTEIKARVQIQSSKWTDINDIEDHLVIYDCGSRIKDFKLEKVEFDESNVILLCDMSGSMSGSIDKLREAVVSFSENMQEDENVCVIGFDDSIVFEEPFTDNPKKIAKAAEKFYSGGGTAIYQSLIYAGKLHSEDLNSNNVIIVMTDGQDGSRPGENQMYTEIKRIASDKNATIYTLGLGSGVETKYLEDIADFGNGSFLYIDSDERLEEFYTFIHGQLNNQYILTYTARNKSLNERKLELSLEDELGSAVKTYYLNDKVYSDEGSDSYNPYTVVDADLTVYGFETKFMYKSSKEQKINLKGAGFDEGDDVSVRISGNVKYNLKAEFVDENTYSVVIPTDISVGTYDVTVSIRSESVSLEREFTLAAQGTQKNLRFGAYNFTALSSSVDANGNTTLSGNVTMNGWMRFKGDVTVAPFDSNTKVKVVDNSGFYINYSSATASGLAKYMAERGLGVSFGALGDFYIYNDPYTAEEYDDFPVDNIYSKNFVNLAFVMVKEPSLSVYPDMLRFNTAKISPLELPLQKQLLRNLGFEDDGLSGEINTELLLNATKIGFVGKISGEDDNDVDFSLVSFPLVLNKLELEIDTLKGDFSLDLGVKIKALKSVMDGMELGFDVKNCKFDGFMLGVSKEIALMTTPVPISMDNFGFGISGFSDQKSDNNLLAKILDHEVTAKFDVKLASLKALLPAISKFIDDEKDVEVASLKNCTIKTNIRQFRLTFDADIELATVLDIGKCHISLGKFDYTNALIGYYNEEQYGLSASLTVGPTVDTTNLKMSATATGEVTIGYPYTGVWLNGKAEFDIKWWILSADADVSGDILMGVYKNTSDNLQFSFILKGTNAKGRNSGFHLYVTRSAGFNVKKY